MASLPFIVSTQCYCIPVINFDHVLISCCTEEHPPPAIVTRGFLQWYPSYLGEDMWAVTVLCVTLWVIYDHKWRIYYTSISVCSICRSLYSWHWCVEVARAPRDAFVAIYHVVVYYESFTCSATKSEYSEDVRLGLSGLR